MSSELHATSYSKRLFHTDKEDLVSFLNALAGLRLRILMRPSFF